jgi:DNA-nicking Smr family endonuclease
MYFQRRLITNKCKEDANLKYNYTFSNLTNLWNIVVTRQKEPENRKTAKNKLEGSDLWEAATRDVKQLPGGKPKKVKKQHEGIDVREMRTAVKESAPLKKSGGVDSRTDQKLRRGKFDIDVTIDLHGFRQDEAKRELTRMLTRCYAQNKRCVLVITGKGQKNIKEEDWWESKPGVLRQKVPEWLKEQPLSAMIVQTNQAQPKHGGTGALYVLLRRKR